MKKILLILTFVLQGTLHAQDNGFFYVCENENFLGDLAIETEDGSFIVGSHYVNLMDDLWWQKPSLLMKFSPEGEQLKCVQLGDSYSKVVFFHENSLTGIFYAIGNHWDPNAMRMYPFITSFDSELNILNMVDVVDFPVVCASDIPDAKAIINNKEKVLFVLAESFNDLHYMIFDLDGNLESYKYEQIFSGSLVGSLFLFQDGSGDFGQYYNGQLVRISEQLETENVFNLFLIQETQWMGTDTIHSVYSSPSLYPTILSLPDGSYLFAEESWETWRDHYHSQWFFTDSNAIFFKTDNNGSVVNSIIIDTRNDTLERPAYHQALDYLYSDDIYLCSFQHLLHSSSGSEISQNHIILMKTDACLNIEWERRYCLGDACHLPTQVLATRDGGCLITGYNHKDDGTRRAFVLKLNSDGFLEVKEQQISVVPYRLFPNPVKDRVYLRYSPDVTPCQAEIYDLQGRLVGIQGVNLESIDMSKLPTGTYTLRVIMKDGKTYADKVVKL